MDLFENFPELETNRLILRRHNTEDVESIFQILSMEEVVKYTGLEALKSIDEAKKEWIEYNYIYISRTGIRWAIIEKSSNELIGSVGYRNYDENDRKAEIGYELTKKKWAMGYMTEALKTIIHFGFMKMNLNRIEAEVDKRNFSSLNVLYKLGFQIEGVKRESEFEKGEYIDLVMLALLKKEFSTS